jgi:hypothetical protein
LEEAIDFHTKKECHKNVQPLDRLIVFLSLVSLFNQKGREVITNFKRKFRKDYEVINRLRLLQAMFFTMGERDPMVRPYDIDRQKQAAQPDQLDQLGERNEGDKKEMIKAKASGSKSVSKQDGGDGLFDMDDSFSE